jgi:putative NADH-flavin reductase/pimeloyl-ACP methyl ester carboxylesterase
MSPGQPAGAVSSPPRITHRHVDVGDVRIFYRETQAREGAPTLLLLHGFPSSSHQYTRLMDALGRRIRMIAPDFPGFGYSSDPPAESAGGPSAYSFDALADAMEGFCEALELDRFSLYAFDFGAPVGLRLASRHPDWIASLVVQNGNAYEVGLSAIARALVGARRDAVGAAQRIHQLLTLSAIRSQYLDGVSHSEQIAPDGWTLDHHLLEPQRRQQIQVDLAFDYHSNVELYPRWQTWLRRHRPPTLVIWGRKDPFFLEDGAKAFTEDIPDAEVHLFETGHFALEERLPEIAPLVGAFVERTWSPSAPVAARAPMKVAVIGASGHLGGAVAREALARGHDVTAIARDADRLRDLGGTRATAANVLDVDVMTNVLAGHDAVVAALKGRDGTELDVVPRAAKAILAALPKAGVRRLVFLGGGGSLLSPSGQRFVDLPGFPPQYRGEALAQAEALEILRGANGAVDWSYASPPPMHLVEGPRSGHYRLRAGDLPITDEGESVITVPDYAAAIVDALESSLFVGARFTAAY